MISSTLFLWPLYLACLPSATAWVFSWTSPEDEFLTSRGNDTKSCTKIDNPVGNIYDWDPKGDNLCIFFYKNANCADPSAGYTCSPWPWSNHESTKHILSFEVTQNTTESDSSSEAPSTPTPTALKTASASASASATATVTSTPSVSAGAAENKTDGSSISGGAIAGIVIGVVAAVVIAGLLLFFLWRRRKQTASSPTTAPTEPGPIESAAVETNPKFSELQSPNQGAALAEKSAYPEQVLRELPTNPVSELGPGLLRAELDGSSHGEKS